MAKLRACLCSKFGQSRHLQEVKSTILFCVYIACFTVKGSKSYANTLCSCLDAASHVVLRVIHYKKPVWAQTKRETVRLDRWREKLTHCHGLRQTRCLQHAGDGSRLRRWTGLHTETHKKRNQVFES